MARPRSAVASVFLVAGLACASPVVARGIPAGGTVTADTVTSDSVTDTTTGWRLENDPSECINSNPRPNCGYKPLDAGERGGALQITLFFVLMAGLGVIGTVIGRNIVRRDRAIAERLRADGASSGGD